MLCNAEFNDSEFNNNLEMSQEDLRSVSVMESTIHLRNGHYELALPWRNFPPGHRLLLL